ncbi:hypothetical protein [Haloactinomyces albus]|uniref:Exporter n=1 Tax=Haloactinomyces albus TaxID=1352928 RepID=A0AAE4CNA5_9ACTN|nr:hypothetical protein [Haloactinomyces albus]MDR7303236.1 putative exporter [Haloactinomyces albus]
MKGYTVHLLFHTVAVAIGAACGIAAGLWLFGSVATAVWVFFGTVLLGIALLVAQTFYLRGAPGERPEARPRQAGAGHPLRTGTRPDLHEVSEPVARSTLQRPSGEQPR